MVVTFLIIAFSLLVRRYPVLRAVPFVIIFVLLPFKTRDFSPSSQLGSEPVLSEEMEVKPYTQP